MNAVRFWCALIFAITEVIAVYFNSNRERSPSVDNRQRYTPIGNNTLLPMFVFALMIAGACFLGIEDGFDMVLSICFAVFLHICCYYIILLILLPVLRKVISARVCALLWLLPNWLYITQQKSMVPERPTWIIHVPENLLSVIAILWIMGFIAVLVWKMVSHIHFRHIILQDAREVTDENVLELWQEVQKEAGFGEKNYRLVYSSKVKTPLSIGFFRKTIRVVLPKQDYSLEELSLVFHHEVIHIGREDSGSKFFMTFCTAMCWFNPLMWVAMRKSADDLELSCDETVLLEADAETRRQYAELLLRTAGDERGFTTCLSATAKAMRYRLKNVIKPRKRFIGGMICGVVTFVLIISCGYVTLAYGEEKGHEYIFQSEELSEYIIENVNLKEDGNLREVSCTDETALNEYLAGLSFYKISGSYSFPYEEERFSVLYSGPDGLVDVTLCDDAVKVTPLYNERIYSNYYYLSEEVDWEYIYTLIQ